MNCVRCRTEGKTPVVTLSSTTKTKVPVRSFSDESGKQHTHDPNVTTEYYACSNGHYWTENKWQSCWCGWSVGKKEVVRPGGRVA